jgi:hypothetical protein
VKLALNLPQTFLDRLSDEFCYWLEGTDAKTPNFSGADQLWLALLAFMIVCSNVRLLKKYTTKETAMQRKSVVNDLTT